MNRTVGRMPAEHARAALLSNAGGPARALDDRRVARAARCNLPAVSAARVWLPALPPHFHRRCLLLRARRHRRVERAHGNPRLAPRPGGGWCGCGWCVLVVDTGRRRRRRRRHPAGASGATPTHISRDSRARARLSKRAPCVTGRGPSRARAPAGQRTGRGVAAVGARGWTSAPRVGAGDKGGASPWWSDRWWRGVRAQTSGFPFSQPRQAPSGPRHAAPALPLAATGTAHVGRCARRLLRADDFAGASN